MRRRALLSSSLTTDTPQGVPSNMIYYTSGDGSIVEPILNESFGANLISNTYSDGRGVMVFDGDVTHIGQSAFEYAYIVTIEMPNSVKSIGDYAFSPYSSLGDVIIPDGVETIGECAFYSSPLVSVIIGNSVKHIGDQAFAENWNLASIYVKPTTPPELEGGYVFSATAFDCIIYVPRASLNTYKNAYGWRDYANMMQPYDF